jgi:hypothetical protein
MRITKMYLSMVHNSDLISRMNLVFFIKQVP